MRKIALLNLGCARNLVDSETILANLSLKGFNIVDSFEEADAGIINTCAFISESKEESIDTILQAVYLKKEKNLKYLIITGCLAQRYPLQIAEEIPEIDAVITPLYYDKIPGILENVFQGQRIVKSGNPGIKPVFFGKRYPLISGVYAYLKISDGCCNNCSYCAIPSIRGSHVSRDADSLIKELNFLHEKTKLLKEVNIIAQDIAGYNYNGVDLNALIDKISVLDYVKWIRLLYVHPGNLKKEVIKQISRNEKVCRYIDLPIQHISNRMLGKMNRHITKEELTDILYAIRQEDPNIVIRTTVMVGFPGESKKDFEELCAFVEEFKFDKLGTFTYSKEEGTPAFNFSGHLSYKEKKSRMDYIMRIQKKISENNLKKFLGKKLDVLIEEKKNGTCIGRTEFDAPEVDGQIFVSGKNGKAGDIKKVLVTDAYEYDLAGKFI